MSVSRSDLWVDDGMTPSATTSPAAHSSSLLPPTTLWLLLGSCSEGRYHGWSLILCAQILVGLSARNESFNFHVLIHHNSIFCHWTSSQDSLGGRLVGFCRPGLMTVTPGPDCRHPLSQSETHVGVSLTNERAALACPVPSSQGEETAVSSVVVQCFGG